MDDSYFRYVVDSMKSGVITINLEGEIMVINEVARAILELEEEKLIGKACEKALGTYPEIAGLLTDSFKYNYLPDRAEIEIKRGAESKIIGFTLSLIKAQGKVIGSLFFFKDLTKMEQLRERELLKDRLAALGQMAAHLAHEIRNPLASIEISAGLLRRKVPQAGDAFNLLENITNEVSRLNHMVTECLEFVKPVKLDKKDISLVDVIRKSITIAKSFFKDDVYIAFKHDEEMPLISADPGLVKDMLINVLKNACESKEGAVRVLVLLKLLKPSKRAKENLHEYGSFLISVEDNGFGISEDVINKVFNPFFTTKDRGSGIGLSMVQKIVDAHKGRIDLDSKAGVGTKFSIYLPILSEKALL